MRSCQDKCDAIYGNSLQNLFLKVKCIEWCHDYVTGSTYLDRVH